jgi:hypothetical protein
MTRYFFTGLLLSLLAEVAMAIEEPRYAIIEKSENLELRVYQPMIVAEAIVSGTLDDASRAGFRIIADYIFGNNTARSGSSEKIPMTAPVGVAPAKDQAQDSVKISMTAPVTLEPIEAQWRVHFVMPSDYTLDSLPTPNNREVTLRAIPERRYAVIRFSGLVNEEKIARKTAELLAWLEHKNIQPTGKPEIARYNPPWTLPFLRRNEIMLAYE